MCQGGYLSYAVYLDSSENMYLPFDIISFSHPISNILYIIIIYFTNGPREQPPISRFE